MHRIAKFHFVSPAQFMTAMQDQGNVRGSEASEESYKRKRRI